MIKYSSRNILTGYLCVGIGIFPGGHMNKAYGLTVRGMQQWTMRSPGFW